MKIVLVGASGYGESYVGVLEDNNRLDALHAVVDPFPERLSHIEVLKDVPVYPSLEAFFEKDTADLVVISSPITFHEEHTVTALKNGAHVLCEKPMCATIQQARNMAQASKKYGKKLGIGFQQSFSTPNRTLKQDILDGKLGKPICLKAACYAPRDDEYYDPNGWKGRAKDKAGRWILDAVATNAMAHSLHNIFFLLGSEMNASMLPEYVEGSVYKARDIETFDTIFLRGEFAGGCRFEYIASHVCEKRSTPRFSYKFANAVVEPDEDGVAVCVFNDGKRVSYGPDTSEEKLFSMMEAVEKDLPSRCTAEMASAHILVCNLVLDNMKVKEFPKEVCKREGEFIIVDSLDELMKRALSEEKLPTELGVTWAAGETKVKTAGYEEFTGVLL